MKFHIRDFYKSLSKNSTFGQNFTKRSGTLHKDLSVFHTTDATIQSAHSCASLATLSTFITLFTTYYAKIQMEHTVSLPWQKKCYANAQESYVTPTIPTLFTLALDGAEILLYA
jgi:hypothetical protein